MSFGRPTTLERVRDIVEEHLSGENRFKSANALAHRILDFLNKENGAPDPIPMYLLCPKCGGRHIDTGEFATKPHHTHACQFCGLTWRPAIVPTVGVQFLPGFKNEEKPDGVPTG